MIKLLLPLALLAAALVVFVVSDPPRPKADVTIINRGEVTTLDPATMSWAHDFRVGRLIGEGLLRQDVFAPSCPVIPGVAEHWAILPDQITYRFTLRSNARWSDGSPVTAEDFRCSWRRMLLPETGADYIGLFHLIDGGSAFTEFRAGQLKSFATAGVGADEAWAQLMQRFDEQVAIRAISPEVLEVRLVRPTPYFLELLAFPAFFPMHQPSLDSCSRLDPASGALRVSSEWTRPPGLICNGPFFVQEWVFKRSMRLVLNPHYWNRQGVHVRSIEFPIVEDAGAQALAFRTGAADVVFDVTAPFRAEMVRLKREFRGRHAAAAQPLQAQGVDEIAIDRALPSDPATSTQVFPAFGTYFYNFNCGPVLADGRPNPLSDARVRRALAMSVDKQGIVERIRRCGERAAAGIIPPGSIQGYSSPKGLSFDPEAARSLLADAGYPQGRGLPVLEILFNKDGGHDLIAQAVAKDWQQLLKVECRLVMKESKTFRQDLKQGRFMISRASWTGDYADPTTFLDINRSTDNNNDRRYASRKYDDMLDRASTLHASPAERMRALAEAERFLVEEEVPFLPLFHHVEINLFDARRVSGITSNPRQVQELINLDVVGDGIGTDEYLPPEP